MSDYISQTIVEKIPEENILILCSDLERGIKQNIYDNSYTCDVLRLALNTSVQVFNCNTCPISSDLCGILNPLPNKKEKKRMVLILLIKRLKDRYNAFKSDETTKKLDKILEETNESTKA